MGERIVTAWRAAWDAPFSAPPLAVGDVVYVPTRRPQAAALHGLALATGDTRWQHTFEHALISGLVAAGSDVILVALTSTDLLQGTGALLALDATGAERWRWAADVQRVSTPTVVGDVAYFTVDTHTLVALKLSTGTVQQRASLDASASLAAPLVSDDEVYIPCMGPQLLAVAPQGQVRWRFDLEVEELTWFDKTPVIVGERLFTASSRAQALALARADGSLQWRIDVGPAGKPLSALTTDGERLYVGARDGVHALDPSAGEEVWHVPTARRVEAAPVVQGEVVYATCHDHHLYALDAATGQALWSCAVERRIEHSPVLTHGDADAPYVLIADRGGTLTAVARPLSAAEHEAANHWREAAQIREALAQRERAAEDYERAGAWMEAARLWEMVGRPLRQAAALEQQIAAQPGNAAVCADLWAQVAALYAGMWLPDKAVAARREAARCRGDPFITVDVEHEGLVLDVETYLSFTVRNEGRGIARNLVIRARGPGFAGGVRETQHLLTLLPGQSRRQWLHVCPRRAGDHVQLEIALEYHGPAGETYARCQALTFPVAATSTRRQAVEKRSILSPLSFADLEIRLFAREERGYPVEFTLNGEQEFPRGYLPVDITPWLSSGDAVEDGRRLFAALVADPVVREAWGTIGSHEWLRERLRVRLRIDQDVAELHAVPWELLRVDDTLLAARTATPFSRYLPASAPWAVEVAARPLRVLAVISDPTDLEAAYGLPPVDVAVERARLEEALTAPGVQLDVLEAPVTLPRLAEKLREGYHVLHYVGHGAVGKAQGEPVLYLQKKDGTTALVKGERLGAMLAHQGVRPHLVVLTACESATLTGADVAVALGPRLIRRGVPAVVAMRGRISQRSAQTFSRTLYARLLAHGVVDLAANEARSTLVVEARPDAAVPVLFMRLQDGRLWAPDERR